MRCVLEYTSAARSIIAIRNYLELLEIKVMVNDYLGATGLVGAKLLFFVEILKFYIGKSSVADVISINPPSVATSYQLTY